MVYETFAKRQKRERGEVSDVFKYGVLPAPLRMQVVYILEAICRDTWVRLSAAALGTATIMREELGLEQLVKVPQKYVNGKYQWDYPEEIKQFILKSTNVDDVLSLVECMLHIIKEHIEAGEPQYRKKIAEYNEHIGRLNIRFLEHGIGYAHENGILIRKDNELVHQTIVKPALAILNDARFKNAQDEYLKAHEHHMAGDYEDCLVNCLKAVESTIRVIADERNWPGVKPTDPAAKLIDHVMTNELLPKYVQTHFTSLKSCLESGVPTVRNKAGGHGKGVATAPATPGYLSEYLLGESAVTIRLLVNADRELTRQAGQTGQA